MILEYPKFKELYQKYVYSLVGVDEVNIEFHFNEFKNTFERSENIALSMLKDEGFIIPDDAIDQIRKQSRYHDDRFIEILDNAIEEYLNGIYSTTRIDKGSICLMSNLLNRACQMRHDDNMLGIVRSVDTEHPRYLYVDFGDEAEVKIDIDELIISGQKS